MSLRPPGAGPLSSLTGGAYSPPGQAPHGNARGENAPAPIVQRPQPAAPNEIYLQDPDVTLWHGDALTVLRKLASDSVHCAVTSPPFYGLRDYGTGRWEGGDPYCAHRQPATGGNPKQGPNKGNNNAEGTPYRDVCGMCGARRVDQQVGLERTPGDYIAKLVEVFRELRRVLRRDGTFWLEVGDSYGGAKSAGRNDTERMYSHAEDLRAQQSYASGYRAKDLIGIPWRLAFALQEDGWWLRAEVIWSKPNAMPESVTDRPTRSHSQIFMLSKSQRYYFDQEAVREDFAADPENGGGWSQRYRDEQRRILSGGDDFGRTYNPAGRNIRSVWTIPTRGYAEAHFAVFPEELALRCILAGCPEHDRDGVRGIVLDPFVGSGTVLHVARKLGRHAIGIDLNAEYQGLAAKGLQQLSLFA